MKRLLLDENIPFGLRRLIPGCDVRHVLEIGWEGVFNGALLTAAEAEGYDVLVTADKNLSYQQNFANRTIGLLVLSKHDWPSVRRNIDVIRDAADRCERGMFVNVDLI